MTLRQLKKYINMSKEQLIKLLYEYIDEHQSNEVVNINQSMFECRKSALYGFIPVQMHINADDVYISYYELMNGLYTMENDNIKEFCDKADIFTLGELEFIINTI